MKAGGHITSTKKISTIVCGIQFKHLMLLSQFHQPIHDETKCSPTNFCGVDLLRLVMLLASRSINAILSEEGCRKESGINSKSLISSPAQSTNNGTVNFLGFLLPTRHFDKINI